MQASRQVGEAHARTHLLWYANSLRMRARTSSGEPLPSMKWKEKRSFTICSAA